MSSIQKFPVEVLMDVFGANDPASKEALQLTCRYFDTIIMAQEDVLPTRLVCDLVYDYGGVRLVRAPTNTHDGGAAGQIVARATASPKGLQDMYQMFGCKTAIRKVTVFISTARWSDAPLTQLIKHFPSVKGAVSLDIAYVSGLPAEVVLDHFDRLEMIVMIMYLLDENPFFWNDLFDSETFRRVSKVHIMNHRDQYLDVDDGELFDFITDRSLIPADEPRVVSFGRLDDGSLQALEQRFTESKC